MLPERPAAEAAAAAGRVQVAGSQGEDGGGDGYRIEAEMMMRKRTEDGALRLDDENGGPGECGRGKKERGR